MTLFTAMSSPSGRSTWLTSERKLAKISKKSSVQILFGRKSLGMSESSSELFSE